MEQFNRMLMAQIQDQLKRGFAANFRINEFCVVATRVHGVLSILSAASVTDKHEAVFGPKSFEACSAYINGQFVKEPLRAARAGDDEGEKP